MNVKKVGNVILAVKDLKKSVDFYNNILGMPIKNTRSNWVDLGKVVLYLVFILHYHLNHTLVLQLIMEF